MDLVWIGLLTGGREDAVDLGLPWPDNVPVAALAVGGEWSAVNLGVSREVYDVLRLWRSPPGGALPAVLRVLFLVSAALRHGVTYADLSALAALGPSRGAGVGPGTGTLLALLSEDESLLLHMLFFQTVRASQYDVAAALARPHA